MDSLPKIMRERYTYMPENNSLKDYKNRVTMIRLRKQEFIPEGETEPIEYYQLLFDVELNGEPEVLKFKCTESNAKLLKACTPIREKSFLDE